MVANPSSDALVRKRFKPNIALAQESDFAELRAIIVRGLAERWHTYDPSFDPALESLDSFRTAIVVLMATIDGEIVGCGTLRHETASTVRVARMSVASEHRRHRVGTTILHALIEQAIRRSYKEIVLETTASWASAVAFYESYGFQKAEVRDGDQHFNLEVQTSEF